MTEKGEESLADAVKTAEAATAHIKDEELRKLAFGKVLDHLLLRGSEADLPRGGGKGGANRGQKPPRKPAPKKKGPMAWLAELASEGFFKKPKDSNEILEKLAERGHHLELPDITVQLQQLCVKKVLRRKKIPGKEGKRQVWAYSNW